MKIKNFSEINEGTYIYEIIQFLADENNRITLEELKKFLNSSVAKEYEENDRYQITKSFLENINNPHSLISAEQLKELIKSIDIIPIHRQYLIQSFVENPQNSKNIISIKDLENLIEFTDTMFHKHEIILSFLENPNNAVEPEDLVLFIEKYGDNDSNFNSSMISIFFARNLISLTEVERFIDLVPKNDNYNIRSYKLGAIKSFLQNTENPHSKISPKQLTNLIRKSEIDHNYSKREVIEYFLENPNNQHNQISIEDLKDLINDSQINDDYDRCEIVKFFLRKRLNELSIGQDSNDLFVRIVKESELLYRVDLISNLLRTYEELKPRTTNIVNIINGLYEYDYLKVEFLKEHYRTGVICIDDLRNIIKTFKEDNEVLELIHHCQQKRILPAHERGEISILSLVKGRFSSKYSSLTECFKDENGDKLILPECLTYSGLETMKGIFGEELLIGEEPITIMDLLSYYDIREELDQFGKLLKPELIRKISDEFKPSKKDLLTKDEELRKFNSLFENDVSELFIPIEKLINYFSESEELKTVKQFLPEKIQDPKWKCIIGNLNEVSYDNPQDWDQKVLIRIIKIFNQTLDPVTEGKIDDLFEKLNFLQNQENINIEEVKQIKNQIKNLFLTSTRILPDKIDQVIKDKISGLFNQIIRKDRYLITQKEVVNFFQIAFPAVSFDQMGNLAKDKLKDFFKDNRDEIAYFFSKIGIDKLGTALFSTLSDGCAHNIGNQFKNTLNSFIFKEKKDKSLLYSILDESIRTILNSGEDLILIEDDPFQNREVLKYYLSPDSLLEKIAHKIDKELMEKVNLKEDEDGNMRLAPPTPPIIDLLIPNIVEIDEFYSFIQFAFTDHLELGIQTYETFSKALAYKIIENSLLSEAEKINYNKHELDNLVMLSKLNCCETNQERIQLIKNLLSEEKDGEPLFNADEVFITKNKDGLLELIFDREKINYDVECKSANDWLIEWNKPGMNPRPFEIEKQEIQYNLII